VCAAHGRTAQREEREKRGKIEEWAPEEIPTEHGSQKKKKEGSREQELNRRPGKNEADKHTAFRSNRDEDPVRSIGVRQSKMLKRQTRRYLTHKRENRQKKGMSTEKVQNQPFMAASERKKRRSKRSRG